MKNIQLGLFIAIVFMSFTLNAKNNKVNTLSEQEKKQGWVLLFDGISSKGWLRSDGSKFPEKGWVINNGELSVKPYNGSGEDDIVTVNEYSDFELSVDFRTTIGANSGIKYFFTNFEKGGLLGLEYQILDDNGNGEGKIFNHVCGSLYDMFPPVDKRIVKPVGEWNTIRIVSKGTHVEHWLNGIKILEFDRNSDAFKKALVKSKYADAVPTFGSMLKGRILLQFHGSAVSFRNVKIKNL